MAAARAECSRARRAERGRVVAAVDRLPRTATQRNTRSAVRAEIPLAATSQGGDRGDINSTDGTEPEPCPTRAEFENPKPEYFRRGYEWWLMREAKRRNPGIVLDILQWGAPAWIATGSSRFPASRTRSTGRNGGAVNNKKFYTQDNADFIVAFIVRRRNITASKSTTVASGTKPAHDLEWIKLLRRTLDNAGLSRVKIVASDQTNTWNIVDAMERDPVLEKAFMRRSPLSKHKAARRQNSAASHCRPARTGYCNPTMIGELRRSGQTLQS